MIKVLFSQLAVVFCLCAVAFGVTALAEEELPRGLQGVTVKEHLGENVDLSLQFTDHNGNKVALRDFFQDGKPVLMTLNYYRCKMLCNLQLNAVVEGLRKLDWTAGKEFRIVTTSIDSRNTPMMAKEKRDQFLKMLGRGPDVDWSFLVGEDANITALASQIGFEYKYDEEEDQFAHGLAIFFVSPEGKLTRYLYGLEYSPRDIKFALLDSSAGKIGSSVEKFILNCFHYDETRGRYGPHAFRVMRYGGLLTVTVVGAGLTTLWRREKHFYNREENNRVV